ncbi:MAG: DNA-binding response regulator [Rhodospirillales bacterium CG15_BIG_FIL_POST_REV_8_21_14_020_66_15]|nr:MAG: DNA-binding response regulator [Rhodospirillales bacterium CG15_BIG_FIL_POST_REV_8_21_14_020_66_15]
MRILVVEDDYALADGIRHAFKHEGFAVDVFADGAEAEAVLMTQDYDLVILDLNLPGMDGLEVLREMRSRKNETPVLILTVRDRVDDRVAGLDLGADDYMTKPFDLCELEARVRALIRRGAGSATPVIEVGGVAFDTVGRRAYVRGKPIDLPRRELCLLEIFLSHLGKLVSKERIAEKLFDFDDDVELTAIELYVHRLRKKLEPTELSIRTIRGLGYLMERP